MNAAWTPQTKQKRRQIRAFDGCWGWSPAAGHSSGQPQRGKGSGGGCFQRGSQLGQPQTEGVPPQRQELRPVRHYTRRFVSTFNCCYTAGLAAAVNVHRLLFCATCFFPHILSSTPLHGSPKPRQTMTLILRRWLYHHTACKLQNEPRLNLAGLILM